MELHEGDTWQSETYIRRSVQVWSGANRYEAVVPHRTGALPPEEIIGDWPSAPRMWLPVCCVCKRTVEGDGRIQDDGFWVHFGDCHLETINQGIENYETWGYA